MSVIFDRIYLHVIFCVRQASDPLRSEWLRPLEHHLINHLREERHPLLGMAVLPDHVHLLIRYRPGRPLGGLIRQLKKSSSGFLKEAFPVTASSFDWQKGFAAISISSQRVEKVRSYLQAQSSYHHQYTVEEEMTHLISNL